MSKPTPTSSQRCHLARCCVDTDAHVNGNADVGLDVDVNVDIAVDADVGPDVDVNADIDLVQVSTAARRPARYLLDRLDLEKDRWG